MYTCHVTTYRRIEAALSSKSSHTSSSSLPATDQPAAGEDGDGFRWNTAGDHASTGSSSKAGHIYLGKIYVFLMRDEKEERKKQARSNKQTRQSNTAHPRQSLFPMYMYIHVHVECRGFGSHPRQLIFLWKSDCLGCVVALLCCLYDLACFFLPSFCICH